VGSASALPRGYLGDRRLVELQADVLCQGEVEAQRLAAVIAHDLILTRVVMTDRSMALTEPGGRHQALIGDRWFRHIALASHWYYHD
jgi:hypothetical protein